MYATNLRLLAARPTTTYRLYSQDDRLLYVGITVDVEQRFRNHRYNHPDWWPKVALTVIEEHPNRAEAAFAEKVAMILERPLKNVVGNHVRSHTYATGGRMFHVFGEEELEFCVAEEDVPRYRQLRLLALEKWQEACDSFRAGEPAVSEAALTWVGYFAALAEDMGYMDDEGFLDLVTGQ